MDRHAIIVFGGTGFIGGNVRALLAQHHDKVYSFGSKDCNLLDRDSVKRILAEHGRNARIVLCSSIGRTTEDSYAAFLKNVAMAHNVAEEAYAADAASLIYLSSTDVYGTSRAELPITEATLPQPDTFYGASKLSAESMISLAVHDTIPAVFLRLPGIYGPGETNTSIASLFIKKALKGESILLSGGGEIKRDYVYIRDLCTIINRFLDRPATGVFNIATGTPILLRELAEAAFEAVGAAPRLNLDAPRDSRSHDLVFDTAKLTRQLKDFTFTPLKQALLECLDASRTD